ncbi:hypothetical protein GIB67_019889 [Kingdonia uniflora]|uniref:Annexin 4 n=1 Tax=Kingdonia uniflora TaxID=39325 RepID=A0A7J7MKF5_9MAGN|nr:hypothetical protein GIB67_019889 [Kingdonia uniflora]
MALLEECQALTKAFSGFGVDEKSIISTLGKWNSEETKTFRKGCSEFFKEDSRLFEKWEHHNIALLQREFLRFQKAVVLWTMHPWERDARLLKEALTDGAKSYNVLIEIACTRSSEELLGARRAYHSIFDHSIEEDIAYQVKDVYRNLLVALVSSYRYEGKKVKEEIAKSEAKILGNGIKNGDKKKPIEDEEVVRILSTRSKLHLQLVFNYYKEIHGKDIAQTLDMAMTSGADENTKEGLIRVIVTRADADMKAIKEEYNKQFGLTLAQKIEKTANGNFKDFLLTVAARSD